MYCITDDDPLKEKEMEIPKILMKYTSQNYKSQFKAYMPRT